MNPGSSAVVTVRETELSPLTSVSSDLIASLSDTSIGIDTSFVTVFGDLNRKSGRGNECKDTNPGHFFDKSHY